MTQRFFRALIALAALGVAILACRDAAIAYWLSADGGDAPGWLRSDALALSNREKTFAPGDKSGAAQASGVAVLARSALRSAALSPAALRDLALASERLGRPDSRELFAWAERTSRRDFAAQNALLRLTAEDGDYAGAVAHLDRMLLVSPDVLPRFLDGMTALAADPDGRTALAGYGGRPWFRDFAEQALKRADDPRDVASLLAGARGLPADTRKALAPVVLARIVASGDYRAARDFAVRFGRAAPATLGDFRLSPATTDQALVPFGWQLPANGDAEVTFAPGQGVQAMVAAASTTIMQRLTLLPPGAYAFDQQLGALPGSGDLSLEWWMTCEGAKDPPLWRQPVPLKSAAVRYRSRIVIPANCPAQRWRLAATTDGSQAQAGFTIKALSLSPR